MKAAVNLLTGEEGATISWTSLEENLKYLRKPDHDLAEVWCGIKEGQHCVDPLDQTHLLIVLLAWSAGEYQTRTDCRLLYCQHMEVSSALSGYSQCSLDKAVEETHC